jgi:hypothetical protein
MDWVIIVAQSPFIRTASRFIFERTVDTIVIATSTDLPLVIFATATTDTPIIGKRNLLQKTGYAKHDRFFI